MWKRREIEVSSSSIVDLKAELFRKKEEFDKQKLRTGSTIRPTSSKPIKKPAKNIGVEHRAKKDEQELAALDPSIESNWIALQRKAKLYDQLRKESDLGKDREDPDSLVDFLQKSLEDKEKGNTTPEVRDVLGDDEDNDDPWMEAIDEFGRTRIIRKSQASELGLKFTKAGGGSVSEDTSDGPSLLSDDMRMEMEREEWERRMREEESKGTHFNSRSEIRTMGVGFYQFSQDEQQRKRQMDELKNIRDETLEKQIRTSKTKDARKEMLEDRKRLLKEKAAAAKRRRLNKAAAAEAPGESADVEKEEYQDAVGDFLSSFRNPV
ncbi:hypothetical protein DFS34DRAFT_609749 [Phlyctochytrium arcticum]|nr:hypothetical protein DFS34DRAFT_609749 [Phlyctochytrium arcticum]